MSNTTGRYGEDCRHSKQGVFRDLTGGEGPIKDIYPDHPFSSLVPALYPHRNTLKGWLRFSALGSYDAYGIKVYCPILALWLTPYLTLGPHEILANHFFPTI